MGKQAGLSPGLSSPKRQRSLAGELLRIQALLFAIPGRNESSVSVEGGWPGASWQSGTGSSSQV